MRYSQLRVHSAQNGRLAALLDANAFRTGHKPALVVHASGGERRAGQLLRIQAIGTPAMIIEKDRGQRLIRRCRGV